MNRKNWLILVVYFVTLLFNKVLAQNDCPGLPSRAKFDTLGYISANIPTDPANPAGKLYLGQGWAQRGSIIRPGFIPSNKPSWAIAIAVAWNLARNINQRVEYPNMGYWMATLIQETELRCATGLTWDDPSHVPDAYDPNVVYAAQINNGCLQIEGPGNAWSALQQAYPNGRIPTSSNPADNTTMYDQLIEGVDGFEASALTKTYYDLYTSQIFNYNVGWDFYENVDCKMKHDPYAYVKMSASNYNGGPNAFLNAEGILNDTGPGCWTGLPATTAGYANDIAKWVSVVENNTSYCEYPAGSSFGGYYDGSVPYGEVTKYLDIIKPMFGDVDFVNDVIPYVEAAFTEKAGSLGGTINFTDFGGVIDAIVLHLPMDKPTAVEGTPIGIDLGCTGDYLPYGHVDIINGTTTMCLGKSVTLELMVDAGNDPDIQYKWFKGDVETGMLIGTNKQVTVTPNTLGTDVYSGQICNSNGCYTVYSNTQNDCQDPRNINGFTVTANDCKLCPFIASGTSVNAVCKGTPDGSITLDLTNFPADYLVTYIATTPVGNDTVSFEASGGTVQMDGVRDGAYNIELQDLSDPTCIAYTTVIVGYDTEINEYIDADLLGITDCHADLGAKIKEQPTPCLWKIQVHTPVYFQWERWVNAVITTSTGKTLIQKDTRLAPRGEIDEWNPAPISEFWLSLNTGDQITIGTAVARTPGASQLRDYQFSIYDENNDLATAIISPAGGATFDGNYVGNPYTVTCPEDVSNYSIAWAPSINNEVTTAIETTGDVIVQSTDRVYTVTATNTENPQCVLKDSVIVPGDISCGSICANPGKVTLINNNDVGLTDTVISCTDSTLYVKLDGNDAGMFLYELYFNDVAQTPTNTTGEFVISDAGEYYVLVSDDADAGNTDCHVYSDTIEFIKQIVPNAPSFKDGDTIICAGAKGVLIEVSTAVSATFYTWNYSGTGLTFNPIPLDSTATLDFADNATDGVLTVVGDNSCGADSLELSITVGVIPTVDLGNDTTVCAANGAFVLDAFNLDGKYEWKDGSVDTTFNVIETGEYWAIASVGTCSDTDTVVVTVEGIALLELGSDTAICDEDLTLDVGTGFTSVIWNGDNTLTTQTLLVATSGKYFVDVEDVFGCVGSDTINITIGTSPIIDLGNDTSVCAALGALTLDGENIGADYLWEPLGETIQTINVDSTAEYKVEVTFAGCSTRDSITVTVLGDVVLDLGPDTTLCSNLGDLQLDAGLGFSSYTWNNGSLSRDITVNTTGEYIVTVEDASGCFAEDTINVTISQSPQVDLGADTVTICATSPDVTFDAGNPGADFNWSSGESSQSIQKGNGDEGDYYIIVTENNCSDSDTVHLKVATELTVDLGGDREICIGTTIDLDAGFGSGFTFDWNNAGITGTQVFTTGEGTVTVRVADAGGCEGRDTITITELNPLEIDLGDDQEICFGDAEVNFSMVSGRSDVTVIGWNDFTTGLSLSTGQDGVYWLEVDSAGCTFRDSVMLTVNDLPSVDLGTDTFICKGTEPTITLSGGVFVSYQWVDLTNMISIGTSEIQNVTATGTYALGVVDTNGCIYADTISVAEEDGTTYSIALDTSICPAGSATLNVPADLQGVVGANWEWLIDNSTGTSYTVDNRLDGDRVEVILSFTNEFGCISNDTSSVRVDNNLPISLKDTAVCAGEDITFVSGYPSLGYAFAWFGGSTGNDLAFTSVSENDAGSISLSVTSDEGCAGDTTINLVVNSIPDPQLSAGSICLGEDRVLDHGLSGVSTKWSTGETSNTIIVTKENRYNVTVTNDATGCFDTASVYLKVNTPPTVNLPNNQLLCEGETFPLATGFDDVGYVNQWAGGSSALSGSIDVKTTGEYTVIVTDVLTKCSAKDTVIFTFLEVPSVDLGPDTSICEGDVITLLSPEVDPSYDFEWSTNEVSTSITVEESGIYSLQVTNGTCADQGEVNVTVHSLPESRLGNDTVVCFEDELNGLSLNPGRVGDSYLWSTMETTQLIDIDAPGTYVVDITNQVGCTRRDWVKVQEDCPSHVWLSNSFTPDGDGLNEKWIIKGRSIQTVEVLVYNRWGELIWEGHSLGEFWDGTHMRYAREVQQDVYVYHLKYTYVNISGGVESKSRIGTITMLR
ncbi:MAG: gliding motility-associated C-terminal domain-containing protein [Flavobacteriales bacterium]|nr:gliding motility-associated C-terminal domain-containing protein [Flavobacteriales bacterium]